MNELEKIKTESETWAKENAIGIFFSDDSRSLP
jgi:hypothetical protein